MGTRAATACHQLVTDPVAGVSESSNQILLMLREALRPVGVTLSTERALWAGDWSTAVIAIFDRSGHPFRHAQQLHTAPAEVLDSPPGNVSRHTGDAMRNRASWKPIWTRQFATGSSQ